jgi:CRP-like cAMP-binding protein
VKDKDMMKDTEKVKVTGKQRFIQSPLWTDILPEDKEKLLACLGATLTKFGRKSIIWSSGDPVPRMGMVMSGEISILMEDLEGRQNVIANVSAPDLFGEVFALAGVKSPVTAYTETGAEVLFLDVQKITAVCRESCAFHRQFVWNLLQLVAGKNAALNQKIHCVGQRTTRDKVDAFLSAQQSREDKNPFTVPFNRAQMADYLCVDRSALSLVLAQMKEEGLIEYHKNEFRLCHLE